MVFALECNGGKKDTCRMSPRRRAGPSGGNQREAQSWSDSLRKGGGVAGVGYFLVSIKQSPFWRLFKLQETSHFFVNNTRILIH